ncbi:Ig-like domain-containing protein [Vibrio agarivorans]|uniref:Ig-like domain-containing protein n=1 Tax=Vibrio agarivorans TaxID=153622 RepID=UPI0025B47209|nr:Ig-like domain-containing protein [Vibrio agarivorans]MDN3663485.1 cellulose-binding domain-containing protein [Vibrio agarivorans]
MRKVRRLTAAIAGILLSSQLYAAEPYDSGKAYSGGTQVTLNGKLYEAKWYANPGQRPDAEYANEWDSPWKLVGDSEPGPGPGPEPGDVIPFIPGETRVNNGDMVIFNGECFIAKNNPGTWETPVANSYFWDITECPDDGEKPELPPEIDLSLLSPTSGQIVQVGESLTIQAKVTGQGAETVEFWVNNTKLVEQKFDSSKEIYTQNWSSGVAGQKPVTVRVVDTNGKTIEEQSVTIKVEAENIDPGEPVLEVSILAPTAGQVVKVDETIAIQAEIKGEGADQVEFWVDNDKVLVQPFSPEQTLYTQDWLAASEGQKTVRVLVVDEHGQEIEQQSVKITVEEDQILPPPGDICDEYNVYPNWTQGNHALGGDIMVHDNVAYKAKWWTSSTPGSDESWELHLNCDDTDPGTPPGTTPNLELPNPLDPLRLEVQGWPNEFVVASPSTSAPATLSIDTIDAEALSDTAELTKAFVEMINQAEEADSESIIIRSDVLDMLNSGEELGVITVKQALIEAVDETGSRIDFDDIQALTDDAQGWTQAYQLILSTLAPDTTIGWQLSIGEFVYETYSGRRAVWNSASGETAELLQKLELFNAESESKANFIAFTKSGETPALSAEQWHNALEYVKQVSDFVRIPVMLNDMPTDQTSQYFMGERAGERQIRKAAHSNVFALLFDTDSAELDAKIESYQEAKVPLYYNGEDLYEGPLTTIEELNQQLIAAEDVMNNEAFLFQAPDLSWIPSTVYKWSDFLDGLNAMHNVGVADNKFWLIDENADEETNIKYAKVAIAAFLAQSMQETIRYNACDENNWDEIRWGAPTNYPMSASCGQLGQKYADYGFNPVSGLDHAYSCPRNDKMEVTAMTHAKWYGAPAPIFAAPDAVLEEQGLLVNGHVGRWDVSSPWCNPAEQPEEFDGSKQAWEREECQIYEDQKSGQFIWDGSSQESVQGCGWWGRGVIQTTGRQNFGTLNHYLGRSHIDPDTIGQTIDGVTVEAPPENPLYSDLDFCSNPGLICSSEENKEIKWIAGLFYWTTSVQDYPDESGNYPGWDYHNELKSYVDGGMIGTQFIDDVSGIVNRGCPDLTCETGEVHNVEERRANFVKVLQLLGLNPQ